MNLRRAGPKDVAAITALVRDAYRPWIAAMGREPGPMTFDYAKAVTSSLIDLHHIEATLAALIQMRLEDDHLMLINVAVAPVYQGRGLGRALMAHAETVALANSLRDVRLFTNKLMESNQRLYERLGYRFDREEPFRGGTVVHMSKRLDFASSAAPQRA